MKWMFSLNYSNEQTLCENQIDNNMHTDVIIIKRYISFMPNPPIVYSPLCLSVGVQIIPPNV